MRDVCDSFEKLLSPKKMLAVKFQAKPHVVVLAPNIQNIDMDPVQVNFEPVPVPTKFEQLVKQEHVGFDETDCIRDWFRFRCCG